MESGKHWKNKSMPLKIYRLVKTRAQANSWRTKEPTKMSKTDPFENSSPFSNPEVSEVLAQTLDALDQAIFGAENSFLETSLKPSLETRGSSGSSGEERADPISPPNSKSSKEAIDDQKQGGYGAGGNQSYSSYSNPLLLNRLCKPSEWQRNPMHNPCPKSAPRF